MHSMVFRPQAALFGLGIALVTNKAASPGDSDPKIEHAQLTDTTLFAIGACQ